MMYELDDEDRICGRRTLMHITERLFRGIDPDYEMQHPSWKEVNLYDFVSAAMHGQTFSTKVHKSTLSFKDAEDKSLTKAKAKIEAGQAIAPEDLENPVARAVMDFYLKGDAGAEPNDLFLKLEKNRAYGFVILNIHSADIDVQTNKYLRRGHFLIRYNENVSNTQIGWQKRLDYITSIFQKQGFDVKRAGGYLHMHHTAMPRSSESSESDAVINEALRGLVSTTHLNITFEEFPETLDAAVEAFNKGTTNVYQHIESFPFVRAVRLEQRRLYELQLRRKGKFF